MPRLLKTEPLTKESFARFGFVLMAERGDVVGKPANRNTAKRYDWLGSLENRRPDGAKLNVCLFRCAPIATSHVRVDLLEKHPKSSQTFVPMNARRYLVLVAEPNEVRPDLSTLRAFLATGQQGISYAPGVWHHPLLALDEETDFACLVHETETPSAEDCVVVTFDEAEKPIVELF